MRMCDLLDDVKPETRAGAFTLSALESLEYALAIAAADAWAIIRH